MTLPELQESLKYYVIDADYCKSNHIDFNEVLFTLKREASLLDIDIFTNPLLIEDVNTINSMSYNN